MSTNKKTNPLRPYQVFFVALGVFCALAIVSNLVVRRVPVHDATIESDLTSIAGAIESYAANQGALPTELSQLTELSNATKKHMAEYEYVPTGINQYQLCATFLAAGTGRNAGKYGPYGSGYADPSQHGKGRECFAYRATLTVPGGPTIQAR
jgi:hypothetical protein